MTSSLKSRLVFLVHRNESALLPLEMTMSGLWIQLLVRGFLIRDGIQGECYVVTMLRREINIVVLGLSATD